MKLGLIKSGVQILTTIGVGCIADKAIDMVKPKNLKGLKNVACKVGGFVLSIMVADKATEYVSELWDETSEQIKDIMSPKPEEEIIDELEIVEAELAE